MIESTWLSILPEDVIEKIWEYTHKLNMHKIMLIINSMHTKFCIWTNPSDNLLNLVTCDRACLQHPYNDFYKFRNKKFCDHPGVCAYRPSSCVDCGIIHIKSPWTDLPAYDGLYKCGNCSTYGFPCRNCASFFNDQIKCEIFCANF